ncbi:MAG: hypothetical protein LUD72_07695 [Bacteroidales bacterium]|nr:hypothetical protein [Bacteroidales bacterium]
MIEKTILNHMSDALNVPVYLEVPENAPEKFVVIEKTGSQRENRITTSMFAVQSYGSSMMEAAELNEEAKIAMDDLIYLPEICSSKLQGDYNFTNATTKHYRYQAGYNVTHY